MLPSLNLKKKEKVYYGKAPTGGSARSRPDAMLDSLEMLSFKNFFMKNRA